MNYRRSSGFALPTVLIASLIMLSVLMVSITSIVAVRTALATQYYTQLAQNASEAGIVYAKACLAQNSGKVTWSTATPLTPSTDCAGTTLSSCPTSAPCTVMTDGNIQSTFSVGSPSIATGGKATMLHASGVVNLMRTTGSTVWRTYPYNVSVAVTATYGSVLGTDTVGDGKDGSVTMTADINLNQKVMPGQGYSRTRICADAVNYSVASLTTNTVTLSSDPAAGCLAAGDEFLLIDLQGTNTDYANVGNYKTFRIQSISTKTIAFQDDSNIGITTTNQRVMLQRVPNYTDVTINYGATLTADPWNGVKGGVVFFRASGTVNDYGTINATGMGWRGGLGSQYYGGAGESYNGGPVAPALASTSANGGGGGGAKSEGMCYDQVGGAGGAGYAIAGTGGGNNGCDDWGDGGSAYGFPDLHKIFFGSGGGGSANVAAGSGAPGGNGGGIVMIYGNNISVAGPITANGGDGTIGQNGNSAGSGGSILIVGGTVIVGSNLITAKAGAGGDGSDLQTGPASYGRIRIDGTLVGTTTPTAYHQ